MKETGIKMLHEILLQLYDNPGKIVKEIGHV
jgi:hypothetical protein